MFPAERYAGVLGRLGSLRPSYTLSGRAAWYGRCPVCQDKAPTHLRLWVGDSGKLNAKCYGGQCQAMGRRGWWQALLSATDTRAGEWFPEDRPGRERRKRPPMKIIATYDYRDAKGRLLYQCCKLAKGGPQKCFYRRPAYEHDEPDRVKTDDQGNRWVNDGAGLDQDKLVLGEIVPAAHVLYRLPELLAADKRQPVLVCEGEPDVAVLESLGFVATCNPHGSGAWREDMDCGCLAGRRVVLFEDNDLAGRRHASWVAGVLLSSAGVSSLRLVRFREFPDHFDVTDWLRQMRFPEMPESGLAPAWLKTQEAKPLEDARKAVTALCKHAPEWAILQDGEQKARLAALNKPADTQAQTLQESLGQQGRAA